MQKSFYKEYYQNIISKYKKGFKLVLGGTGLGKTSGIIQTIKQNTNENIRFFYVANRLQLLNGLAKDLEKEKIGYCLQKRDLEIIKEIPKNSFTELLQNPIIQKYAEKIYKTKNFNFIERNYDLIQEFTKGRNTHLSKSNDFSDFLNEKVRSIFSFFRSILKAAFAEKNQKSYIDLIQNPTIEFLLPYIDFKNNPSEKRVFLVSLQKAFYGFFDGNRVINLYKLKNDEDKDEQNIIFLDEFDFLENDLLSQICKDTAIEQPFSFVELFYNVFTKYKLPRKHFLENHPEMRTELKKITEEVEKLMKQYSLPFPKINHFLCDEPQLKGTSIFQTRYSVGNYPIFLNDQRRNYNKDKINAFYLEIVKDEKKPNAYVLLNVINQSTSAIVRFFKELEFENPEIYRALVQHCFGTSDVFKRILKQIRQHPYRRKAVSTNESKMYYNGFGLYEIYNFGYPTDNEEVELKYYSLFSTPESILLHLTKNNLVFGLSATAEIERYIKNFDLYWLKNELRITDKEGNLKEYLYYDIENQDRELIKQANELKFEKRQSQLKVKIAQKSIPSKISTLIDNVAQSNPELFATGKKQEYRKKRLVHFFATLQWIAENQKTNNTNLLFFSSYKRILHIFKNVKEPESEVYYIQSIDNHLKNCYRITFCKKDFIVLFFNASQGKEIAQNEKEQNAYYELFWSGLPVLLVTTYPSAGNGINLFYYKNKKKKQKLDFANIHLLDSPFYFFSPIDYENDTEQEKNEKIKANIYYLAKLEKNKIISPRQFKVYLDRVRRIDTFNGFYLSTPDGLFNRVATYIQALGRIERIWEQMDNQVIRLDSEVYNHLEDFATKDKFYSIFTRNEPYFSQNVKTMFSHIIKNKFGRQQQQRRYQWEGLKTINNKCIKSISIFLAQLNLLRENKLSTEKAQKIRKEWQRLREFALKQSFAKYEEIEIDKKTKNNTDVKITVETFEYKLLKKYGCIFETDLYDHRNKCLWLQENTNNIGNPRQNLDSSFYAWNLDSVFLNVQNNSILRGYFDLNGYEQGFIGKGIYFTPYFYQCVLAGAIGEEAVKAVFEKEKINLNEKEIINELFELIDLKIEGKNWYIDAKNYSEETITNFQLQEDDYFYRPNLNEEAFREKAQKKLDKITEFNNNKGCKLIYINAFGSGDRPTYYYDELFNEINNSFDKAKIIVCQSMLKTGKSKRGETNYSSGFQYFISELKNQITNA